jgi:hypothetical protein
MSAFGAFFNKVLNGFLTELKLDENNQAIMEQVENLSMTGIAFYKILFVIGEKIRHHIVHSALRLSYNNKNISNLLPKQLVTKVMTSDEVNNFKRIMLEEIATLSTNDKKITTLSKAKKELQDIERKFKSDFNYHVGIIKYIRKQYRKFLEHLLETIFEKLEPTLYENMNEISISLIKELFNNSKLQFEHFFALIILLQKPDQSDKATLNGIDEYIAYTRSNDDKKYEPVFQYLRTKIAANSLMITSSSLISSVTSTIENDDNNINNSKTSSCDSRSSDSNTTTSSGGISASVEGHQNGIALKKGK